MTLANEQIQAINKPIGDTMKILAGAGTGKTRVLVERYIKFVFEDKIPPDQLLALTFTKKAAAEMHERIFDEVMKKGDKTVLRQLYGAWIMNFHQFSFRLIKENAAMFGIDPDTNVAGGVDLARARNHVYQRFEMGGIGGVTDDLDEGAPVPAKLRSDFDRYMSVIEKARTMLWSPADLLATVTTNDLPGYRRAIDTIIGLWQEYESELKARKILDFSDMIRLAVQGLATNERLREKYQGRFAHILVDEFQDTSAAQSEMLRLLAGDKYASVTVVGDDKQSIYRWRDARVENLREFSGKARYLKKNYRSKQEILELAHRFIIEDPMFARDADKIRLQAFRGGGDGSITVFHPEDDSTKSFEDEARAVGAWILSLQGHINPLASTGKVLFPIPYGEIAILLRSLKSSSGLAQYEAVLQELGIPYVIHGGVGSLEQRVLKLLRNLLSLLIYPDDVKALLSVLETAPMSMSDRAINDLFNFAREAERSRTGKRYINVTTTMLLDETTISKIGDDAAQQRMHALMSTLTDLAEKRSTYDFASFIGYAMETTQFYYQFFCESAHIQIVDAMSKAVTDVVDTLVRRHEGDLANFLEALNTILQNEELDELDTPYFPEDRVRIMTVHQAKGLEFPAVAVPGIKNPHRTSEDFYLLPEKGLYMERFKDWGRGRKDVAPFLSGANGREQEERCLLYVAMTRAKDHLFISSPFANGNEGKKGKNYFASILDVLRKGSFDVEEIRDVSARLEGPTVVDTDKPTVVLADVLDEWRQGRERQAAAKLSEPIAGLETVNWRGLLAFDRCPLQYSYRYVAGLESLMQTPELETSRVADDEFTNRRELPSEIDRKQFGQFVHRFLFEWMSRDRSADDSIRALLLDLSERFGFQEASRVRVVKLASDMIASFLKSPLADAQGARLELPVQFRVGNLIFQGIVDRLDKTENGHRIVDYKGQRERPEYRFQVEFYAWILNQHDSRAGSAQLCYLQSPTRIEDVDVSPEITDRIGKLAVDLETALSSGHFLANPGRECTTCSFNTMCPHAVNVDG